MAKSPSSERTAKGPELKIGPYPGGIGVAIWLNTVDTDHGPRKFRSITISPRRYRDSESGLVFLRGSPETAQAAPAEAERRPYPLTTLDTSSRTLQSKMCLFWTTGTEHPLRST